VQGARSPRGRGAIPDRPTVAAVPAGVDRPRWSVMVPTYHCARYLEQTLTSVLEQDPGPAAMEIVVVDDHSTRDDPETVVRALAPDRVRFYRQPSNVGHVRNFNTCLQQASGEWVHLLHGDDWVEDGFYAAADAALARRPDLAAFVCRYRYFSEATGADDVGRLHQSEPGVLPQWLERLAEGQQLQAPSIAVRRSAYEAVGGFDLGISGYGEDWEMWLRVATAGPVWWEPTPLAVYRIRDGSLSDRSRLRSNMADMRHVIALNESTLSAHLPPDRVRELSDGARRSLARALLRRTRRSLASGDRHPPWVAVHEALRSWPRRETALGSLAAIAHWLSRWTDR
jgi:GT2 family glycosyltransferase